MSQASGTPRPRVINPSRHALWLPLAPGGLEAQIADAGIDQDLIVDTSEAAAIADIAGPGAHQPSRRCCFALDHFGAGSARSTTRSTCRSTDIKIDGESFDQRRPRRSTRWAGHRAVVDLARGLGVAICRQAVANRARHPGRSSASTSARERHSACRRIPPCLRQKPGRAPSPRRRSAGPSRWGVRPVGKRFLARRPEGQAVHILPHAELLSNRPARSGALQGDWDEVGQRVAGLGAAVAHEPRTTAIASLLERLDLALFGRTPASARRRTLSFAASQAARPRGTPPPRLLLLPNKPDVDGSMLNEETSIGRRAPRGQHRANRGARPTRGRSATREFHLTLLSVLGFVTLVIVFTTVAAAFRRTCCSSTCRSS